MDATGKKYDKYQNFPTRFRLSVSLECFGKNSRKPVNSGYPMNSLKVDVFLSESNARFQRPSIKPGTHNIREYSGTLKNYNDYGENI